MLMGTRKITNCTRAERLHGTICYRTTICSNPTPTMDDMQGVEQVYLSPSTPSIPHNGQCNSL